MCHLPRILVYDSTTHYTENFPCLFLLVCSQSCCWSVRHLESSCGTLQACCVFVRCGLDTYVGHIATLISNLFSLFFAAGSWQLLQLGFGLTSNCVAVLLQLTHDTDSNLVSSNPVVLL